MSEIISNKKIVFRWAMYDWANSVYNLVITSTIFPAYFLIVTSNNNQQISNNTVRVLGRTFLNTALYNYLLGVAFIIVAILLPVLSSIADVYGNKKKFLQFFCIVGSIACSFLFFFDSEHKNVGYICLIIACVAYWCSLVFYNAYLIEIVPIQKRDKTSALGFTMGYIGSVILQIICFILIIKNDIFKITQGTASKLSFLLVGIWWFGFGLYAIYRLPNNIKKQIPNTNIFISAYKELFGVLKILKNNTVVKYFILSFFFFNMGVQTVMLAATIYGKNELNISTDVLMISILLIQLIAIPGSFVI
ncbi:MAG: MFS transporter, partial [Sediminibacterium sp.]|nr:MFS transporter [Sediminibacterium sp.]